jgi:hypothetical protein
MQPTFVPSSRSGVLSKRIDEVNPRSGFHHDERLIDTIPNMRAFGRETDECERPSGEPIALIGASAEREQESTVAGGERT